MSCYQSVSHHKESDKDIFFDKTNNRMETMEENHGKQMEKNGNSDEPDVKFKP